MNNVGTSLCVALTDNLQCKANIADRNSRKEKCHDIRWLLSHNSPHFLSMRRGVSLKSCQHFLAKQAGNKATPSFPHFLPVRRGVNHGEETTAARLNYAFFTWFGLPNTNTAVGTGLCFIMKLNQIATFQFCKSLGPSR